MRPIQFPGRRHAAIVGAVLALSLAVPAAASADTTGGGGSIAPAVSRGATITVDPVIHVQSKLLATVDASFICDPLLVYDWETGTYTETTDGRVEFGDATIIEASGRLIVSGTGGIAAPATVVCDGTTEHHASYQVVASNTPWKNGAAVVGITVTVVDPQFGCPTTRAAAQSWSSSPSNASEPRATGWPLDDP